MENAKVKEETCSCCGHKLGNHIDEKEGWRCRCLGPGGDQCEYFLRDSRYEDGLAGYSFERKIKKYAKEEGLILCCCGLAFATRPKDVSSCHPLREQLE